MKEYPWFGAVVALVLCLLGNNQALAKEKNVVFGTLNLIVPEAATEMAIQDIVVYNKDERVQFGSKRSQFSCKGAGSKEFHALFDGNPETVFFNKKYAGKYLRLDTWVRNTATRMIVASNMKYAVRLPVLNKGGSVSTDGKTLAFDKISERMLVMAAATDYVMDYARKWRGGDPDLRGMVVSHARFLLIACSRPGSLPSNLQGLWNNRNNPPWRSDYHSNINLQMNDV